MFENFSLFKRTSELESKIDQFFDKLAEASVIYRLAVRGYLREGASEEFKERLDTVGELETQADSLRRDIEQKLPSSRELAKDLSISRITVKSVYEQLIAEGYLKSKTGSGTFVSEDLEFFSYKKCRLKILTTIYLCYLNESRESNKFFDNFGN